MVWGFFNPECGSIILPDFGGELDAC